MRRIHRTSLRKNTERRTCQTYDEVVDAVSNNFPWAAMLVYSGPNSNTLRGYSDKWWSISSITPTMVSINHGAAGKSGRSEPFVKYIAEGLSVLREKLGKGYVFQPLAHVPEPMPLASPHPQRVESPAPRKPASALSTPFGTIDFSKLDFTKLRF